MDIRKQRIALLFISVAVIICYINPVSFPISWQNHVMSVEILAEDEFSDMIADKEKMEVGEGIQFNGDPAAFDKMSSTFFIPQTLTAEVWEGSLRACQGSLYFLDDQYLYDKSSAIKEGHIFKLYCVYKDQYIDYNIVFTGMPILSLCAESSVWEDDENEMVMYGWAQVYDQYHSALEFQSVPCSFYIRGGSSHDYEKKGYKLELDNRAPLLGMRNDDDWILNALYDDAGLIHNKISVEVWKEIAANNHVMNDEGFAMEFVELFLDNEYCGVYGLMERIDKKGLALGKKDILYKCRAYRIPEEHNYSNEDTDGARPIFLLKYPKDFREEDWEPIKSWVDLFLNGGMENYEDGANLLDMENAVDINLFCMLIGGTDNLRKNNYFVAEYQQNGSYRIKKVPWDLNASWGNPWVDREECNFTQYDPDYYKNVSAWSSDLNALYYYDRQNLSALLRDRWRELREKGIISKEKIGDLLDGQFEYLYESGAYERNYELWTNGTEYWEDDYIYEYVEKRIDFLDQYYEQLYEDSVMPKIYEGIDYFSEFDTRYYWEANKEIWQELNYPYDTQVLLEHYALFGKQYGLKAFYDGGEAPGTVIE